MKQLVGQGKPFHSALDKAAGMMKRKVGTGAEFMKELMGITGIKPTELHERGLTDVMGMPRMTHDQFMANLAIRPAPAIGEKVLGEQVKDNKVRNQAWDKAYEEALDDLIEGGLTYDQARQEALELADERINRHLPEGETQEHRTYHGNYTLPGGSNYREMLIKAPKGVDNQEKIMELEAKLRRAPNTNNEEQDQWNKLYNQIRDLKAEEDAAPKPYRGVLHHFGGEPGILASMRLKDRKGPNGEKLLHLEELQSDWHQEGRDKGYTTLTPKELEELRALTRREVEEDGLFPHDMSRSRELEAKIGEVPNAPFKKNWEEMALKRLVHHAAEKGYHGIVVTPGQEQADRYPRREETEKLAQEKGMKSFYDSKVPNILNSIGKKYGVKTELHGHKLPGDPSQRGDASERLGVAHVPLAGMNPEQVQAFNQRLDDANAKHLHHFPITEDMRKDVLTNGLPLYAEGGIIHKAGGGSMRGYTVGSSVIKDTSKTVQNQGGMNATVAKANQAQAEAGAAIAASMSPAQQNAMQSIALAMMPGPIGLIARLVMMAQQNNSAEGPASTPAQAATQSSNADSPGSTASKAAVISNAMDNNLGIISNPAPAESTSGDTSGSSVGEGSGIGIGSGATSAGSTGIAANASVGAQAVGMTSGPNGPAGAVGEGSASGDGGSSSGGGGGGGGGGGCCFIMLEARYGNGTMDFVVRRYRDEKMTDRNRRGYYKLAEVFVPLMRKSKLFKFMVTKTFADPLVSYGKYYYGENRWGWIFKPLEKFWLGLFDTLGTKTKFIRENGEVV